MCAVQGHKCRETSARGSASTAAMEVTLPPAPIALRAGRASTPTPTKQSALCATKVSSAVLSGQRTFRCARTAPPGRYSLATGVSDVSGCTNCSAGKYGTVAGSSDSSSCQNCGSGRFQAHEGSTRCQTCDPGRSAVNGRSALLVLRGWKASGDRRMPRLPKWLVSAAAGAIRVQRVRSWSQRGERQRALLVLRGGKASGGRRMPRLPKRLVSVGPGATRVQRVRSGRSAVNGSARCLSCVPGKFGRGCRDCPTGYFQRQEAQTNCTACPKGTTTNGRNGSSECTRCDLGRFGANGTCLGMRRGALCRHPRQHRVRRVPLRQN